MNDRLGSAEWADAALVEQSYAYTPGSFWLGRSMTQQQYPIGFQDDRHICLVSGSRSGKGASTILTNLCLWPGSAVVIDPKGENASVTAARRGRGSEHAAGMGQVVHILDPFGVATLHGNKRSQFNPLDAMQADDEESIDVAGRIADALVVVKDGAKDPFWDESARGMVKGLLLHVLTSPHFEGRRDLVTVRELITRGYWEMAETLRDMEAAKLEDEPKEKIPDAQTLLWTAIHMNGAFDGILAGIGDTYLNMLRNAPKQFESVVQVANRNTEFIDSPGMRRVLSYSDFQLSELKTRREGMTIYLSLPARFMNTHFRWLRMMTTLIVNEMEITQLPKEEIELRKEHGAYHPVLMVLDEFAGLKRMEIIENAVAQIAGFGVRLFFVLQSLEQLKAAYQENWETFLSNSGLKIFYGIEDHFTRDYVAKLTGETEIIRVTKTSSEGESEGISETIGSAESWSVGRNQSTSENEGSSKTDSGGGGKNESTGQSENTSDSHQTGTSGGSSQPWEKGWFSNRKRYQGQGTDQDGWSDSVGHTRGSGTSRSQGSSTQWGWARGTTFGKGTSSGTNTSESTTKNRSTATNKGKTSSRGLNEGVHKRPLINPDEIGRLFSRIDDKFRDIYPGLALVLISGTLPAIIQRQLYYEDPFFIGMFDPHPVHGLKVAETVKIASPGPWVRYLLTGGYRNISLKDWRLSNGDVVSRYQPVAHIEGVRYWNRKAELKTPRAGSIGDIPAEPIPLSDEDTPAFSLRYYDLPHNKQKAEDPFAELKSAARDLHYSRRGRMFWLACIPAFALGLVLLFLLMVKTNAGRVVFSFFLDHAGALLGPIILTWEIAAWGSLPAIALWVYLWRKDRLYPGS